MLQVGGIVLCGGESLRMGRAKAWLPFGGEVLLQRVVRILGEVVAPVVVVAAPEQEVPPLPLEVAVVRDALPGQGPLQGLLAGLETLQGKVEAAYLAGCDAPFLKPAFVRRLIDLLGTASICVPSVDGFHQPLAAVYRVAVVDTVRRLLAEQRRGPSSLIDAVPTRVVQAAELVDVDSALESLRNLNTAEDYATALRELCP